MEWRAKFLFTETEHSLTGISFLILCFSFNESNFPKKQQQNTGVYKLLHVEGRGVGIFKIVKENQPFSAK